jgi:predicted dehydrogenase
MSRSRANGAGVRFAVVGAGPIARTAVLPAFAHAHDADLVALVSDDPAFRDDLREHYRIEHVADREGYPELLRSGAIDAIYVTAPSHLRCELAVLAAEAGVHVLCEQPMALSIEEGERMIAAARTNDVRFMVAHRPDFERAQLEALDEVDAGVLGEIRFFEATFSAPVGPTDPRLRPIERGGGALFELGVYCIHAARQLMRAEPIEVIALRSSSDDPRFRACDQTSTALMRFAGDRLATFTVGLGTTSLSTWRVVGAEGLLEMRPAFEHGCNLSYTIVHDDGARIEKTFERRDVIAPELSLFSRCILEGREPHSDGAEGLADLRIACALAESADEGRVVSQEDESQKRVGLPGASPLPGLF